MSVPAENDARHANLLSFLAAVIIATFLGALIVVIGSSASRTVAMSWEETTRAVADAGLRGSAVAVAATVLLWFPTYSYISKRMRLVLQLPVMAACGAATALPVAIIDATFNLNPGFTGILTLYAFFAGIWSASLAWLTVTLCRRLGKLASLRWIGLLITLGALLSTFTS